MEFPQFQSAAAIIEKVRAPAVKVPPPVLQDDGNINREYFSVLAAKAGPFVNNVPSHFEHDYPEDRIERCVKTQALAQEVHNSDCLDIDAVVKFIGSKEKVVKVLPTIAYMNLPGPPGDSGGSMVGSGAVILTEDRIILCGTRSEMSASAKDSISGTTMCTYIMPCCPGFCGCLGCCRLTTFSYEQVANRQNDDLQDTIKLSGAKVSFKVTNVTDILRKYVTGSMPSEGGGGGGCCAPCKMCCQIICGMSCTAACFYHGSHTFAYADKPENKSVDAITTKTVGHDDTAWGVGDELTLASLMTDKKTKDIFKDPSSAEFRSKMIEKFGSKYTPEQCYSKVSNMLKGLKTADKCTRKTVMALSVTHWDPASQKVRTTVCVCDPNKVKTDDMMQFQVEASGAKNSMSESGALCSGSAAPVASASASAFSGGGGGGAMALGLGMLKALPVIGKFVPNM